MASQSFPFDHPPAAAPRAILAQGINTLAP
jgi:hypothetical protein